MPLKMCCVNILEIVILANGTVWGTENNKLEALANKAAKNVLHVVEHTYEWLTVENSKIGSIYKAGSGEMYCYKITLSMISDMLQRLSATALMITPNSSMVASCGTLNSIITLC